METFGTVKIYKNNLQKLYDETTIVYTRGQ